MKGASLTSALFVFQACYGTPMNSLYEEGGDAPMSFSIVSHDTGKPLEGVKIQASTIRDRGFQEIGVSGADGTCDVQIPYRKNQIGPFLRFEDAEGKYFAKDTSLADLRQRDIVIKLDPVK